MIARPPFILASASPRRLELLARMGIIPDQVIAADIDETPHKSEQPNKYAIRIASEKAAIIAAKNPNSIILAADTVVAAGSRILPKAEDETTARKCLTLLSGRRHRVYTAVSVITGGKEYKDIVMTQVRFARLSSAEIERYVASKEWHGKAGGYAIQGCAEAFIPAINGSHSNVIGLPLMEACALLKRAGYTW